jgi:hypothetical protein
LKRPAVDGSVSDDGPPPDDDAPTASDDDGQATDDAPPDDSSPPGGDGTRADDAADGDEGNADGTVEVLETTVSRRSLRIGAVVFAVLLLIYSVLIAGQLLLWVGLITPFVFLYFVWRFVRAHERIAAAQERRVRD